MLSRATVPPAASTPSCPVPGPNNSPGLILGLGLGLGWSLALLPSAQAASITDCPKEQRHRHLPQTVPL